MCYPEAKEIKCTNTKWDYLAMLKERISAL